MAFQESVAVRNARLDAIATAMGTSAILKIFSGAEPANCAAADPTGPLVTMNLPSTYFTAAAAGVKAKTGSWTGTAAGAGTAASFRLYDSGLVACHMQGNIGTDMTLDNTSIAVSQVVTVNTFQITAGNA